jgi:hypothetical protein
MVFEREALRELVRDVGAYPRHEYIPGAALSHGVYDTGYLYECLALPEYDLRDALPQSAVVVHLCIAEIFERGDVEMIRRVLWRYRTVLHGPQQTKQFLPIHFLLLQVLSS